MTKHAPFTRGKALRIVFAAALVILAFILLRSFFPQQPDLRTPEGRQMFLSELGWEIDPASEACKNVRIPETLEGILQQYNEMQKKQGYDLSRFCGEGCEQYTYTVTNYPAKDETVLVTLYVQGKQIIAGDIHSTAMNGFMHGIHKNNE